MWTHEDAVPARQQKADFLTRMILLQGVKT